MSDTLNILQDLIDRAKAGGADAADAVAIDTSSRSISYREGSLEDVGGSESQDIGLRVIIGKRQAITSSSDRNPQALATLVERTLDMAKAVPEDPYCGLAPDELLFKGALPDLDLKDASEPNTETLGDLAKRAEDAARNVDGVTNSDGGGASAGSYSIALATSNGFGGYYEGSSRSVSVSAVAGTGTGMERDYDYSSARHMADLSSPELVGKKAGEQAVARLNPTRMDSGSYPVVFAPRVANSLVGHFIGAINGNAVARGSSFLKDQLHEQVFSTGVTIIDDPLMRRGLVSRAFDGEGLKVEPQALAEDGVLTTWMLNMAAARQLDMEPTGHGSRGASSPPGISGSNIYMQPSEISPSELMADIKDGFYVTELIGMGVNGVTGDYSRGAAGFRIQNGEITNAVSEITIASNLKEMFKQITPASDLEFRYGTNAPTVRIDSMMIAGA